MTTPTIRNAYSKLTELYTPETLISPEETVKEMIRQMTLYGAGAEKTLSAIRKVEMTYEAVQGRSNAIVFAPAWKIQYTDSRWPGILMNAVYCAEDGMVIRADYE